MSMTAKPETQPFAVRQLSPLMAAEVVGLDLRDPLDKATRDARAGGRARGS